MQTLLSFHGSSNDSCIYHLLLRYRDTDTAEQCRDRRHRRIQMRRSRWCFCGQHFHPQLSSYRTNYNMTTHEMPQHNEKKDDQHRNPMPDFGKFSIIRKRSESLIDDGLFVKEDFCRLELLGGQPMHFFAVFDAHGDPHVSTLCKQLVHQFVAEELQRVCITPGLGENLSLALEMGSEQQDGEETRWHGLVGTALERSFQRMNRLWQHTCTCGNITDDCRCGLMILTPPVVSVVAILTARNIVIANSGTSRAVLGRAGSLFPLFDGSKPKRLDALDQRLRAVGGRVLHHNGIRVYEILNMSQSPVRNGDHQLVNISITERKGNEDECLILANHGIWDAVSDEMACRVATTSLTLDVEGTASAPGNNGRLYDPNTSDGETDMFFSSRTNSAAAILCRLAVGRGSRSDVSAIVVNLAVRS
ncbi:probable protein phosphatase 2C 75 [Argentina anserina]|uniref:probable protein phosphatase 2C 75 n=1 Tax=Argentina anserina TaxID=57926 RepID=UPI002176802A|nr:probable protein phosphatase 2C 75 [Potentilla anserina]